MPAVCPVEELEILEQHDIPAGLKNNTCTQMRLSCFLIKYDSFLNP